LAISSIWATWYQPVLMAGSLSSRAMARGRD
jgi:hypothetical protein